MTADIVDKVERIKFDEDVRSIDLTVTAEHLEDDLFKIYSQLFTDISRDEIIFEELQGGYVNSIIKLSLKKDKSKSLIFRTFGMKFNKEEMSKSLQPIKHNAENQTNGGLNNGETSAAKPENGSNETVQQPEVDFSEVIFSRMTEYKVMNEISKYGLCKPVYARYTNGIAYGYTQGVVLNGALMLTNDFLNEMAIKLAQFHSIKYDVPGIEFKTHYDRVMGQVGPAFQAMIEQIDDELGDKLNEYPLSELPKAKVIGEEEANIYKISTELGLGRIVFCHNDTNQKNIIWNAQERSIGFIDFEMTMNNYAILELGYLFGCYPGHFLYDFNKDFFPNLDYRRRFLRKYLEEFNKLNEIKLTADEFETELHELVIKTNLTTLTFLLRLTMIGKFFDHRPEMFKNEDLRKKKEATTYFCSRWSLEAYKLYEELKDDFIKEAEQYLEKKKQNRK